MHARGIPPASNVTITDIEDYCATFEKKMGSFLQPRADLTDDEAGKLGMKNEEDEVEKFVQVIFDREHRSRGPRNHFDDDDDDDDDD